jgi:Asp-tRNA(Asn)/Glu-tRNA(Gln) amidotransferase A subunit family amidase
MAGHSIGPLAGIAMGVKDLILTKGIRTTFGSYAYRDFVPAEDDVVVERLRRGDAIILGKTNVRSSDIASRDTTRSSRLRRIPGTLPAPLEAQALGRP